MSVWGATVHKDYLTFKHGQLWEVRCKGCGAPIKKMMAADNELITDVDGQRTRVRRMVLMALGSYREIEIAFSDGSKHITCLCADCVETVDLQQIHDADMEQLRSEGFSHPVLEKRRPVGINRVGVVLL